MAEVLYICLFNRYGTNKGLPYLYAKTKSRTRNLALTEMHVVKLQKSWISYKKIIYKQKQPPRGVLSKRRSVNMQHIYRRTPMPKWDFNKVAKQLYQITLRHGCSPVNLLHIFRTPFSKTTSEWLAAEIRFLRYTSFEMNWQPLPEDIQIVQDSFIQFLVLT